MVFDEILIWHTYQNDFMREMQNISKWYIDQVSGDYMAHVKKILLCWKDKAKLQDAGFVCDYTKAAGFSEGDVIKVGDNRFRTRK